MSLSFLNAWGDFFFFFLNNINIMLIINIATLSNDPFLPEELKAGQMHSSGQEFTALIYKTMFAF